RARFALAEADRLAARRQAVALAVAQVRAHLRQGLALAPRGLRGLEHVEGLWGKSGSEGLGARGAGKSRGSGLGLRGFWPGARNWGLGNEFRVSSFEFRISSFDLRGRRSPIKVHDAELAVELEPRSQFVAQSVVHGLGFRFQVSGSRFQLRKGSWQIRATTRFGSSSAAFPRGIRL